MSIIVDYICIIFDYINKLSTHNGSSNGEVLDNKNEAFKKKKKKNKTGNY